MKAPDAATVLDDTITAYATCALGRRRAEGRTRDGGGARGPQAREGASACSCRGDRSHCRSAALRVARRARSRADVGALACCPRTPLRSLLRRRSFRPPRSSLDLGGGGSGDRDRVRRDPRLLRPLHRDHLRAGVARIAPRRREGRRCDRRARRRAVRRPTVARVDRAARPRARSLAAGPRAGHRRDGGQAARRSVHRGDRAAQLPPGTRRPRRHRSCARCRGRNSWESLAAAAAHSARTRSFRSDLGVATPTTRSASEAIADELGLTAHVSPTRDQPAVERQRAGTWSRRPVPSRVGRIIGYRRLLRLEG